MLKNLILLTIIYMPPMISAGLVDNFSWAIRISLSILWIVSAVVIIDAETT